MALAAGWSCDLRTSPRHFLKKLRFVLMRRCVAVFREELNQILGPSNMKMIEKQIGCLSLPSTSFLLNTLLPFMCRCFNCFPDLVSRHFVSQMPTMKTHAVRLIEHMSPSQQRNLRILFDIPANALTRSVSSKNTITFFFDLDSTDFGCRAQVLRFPSLPHWLLVAAAFVQDAHGAQASKIRLRLYTDLLD